MNHFEVSFSGLKIGQHQFEFEISKVFFDTYQDRGIEGELIQDGDIHFDLDLEKKETMMVLDFSFHGSVISECAKCLEGVEILVEGKHRVIAKFSDEPALDEDDLISIPSTMHKIDLSEYLYQFIYLALPARVIHDDGECDISMLDKLREYEVGTTDSDEDEIDPRWNTLKDLFKDKN